MTNNSEQGRKRRLAVVVIAVGSCLLAGAAALAWSRTPSTGAHASQKLASPAETAPLSPEVQSSHPPVERVAAEQPSDPTEEPEALAPIRLEDLPDDIKKEAIEALRACLYARKTLGLPNAEWSYPCLTLANARALVEREAQLKQQILDSAMMEHGLLQGRLDEDPTVGVRVAAHERAKLDALLAEKYPGWPEGYQFAEEDDGAVVRVAAWRVADDPVLQALVRDHDALTGEYAATIRSQYIQYLSP